MEQQNRALQKRKQRAFAKSFLRKYYMVDDIIAHYLSQLAGIEHLIEGVDELKTRIEKPFYETLRGDMTERKQALTTIIQSLIRWKDAVDDCVMFDLTEVENKVFLERYVQCKLWKWILSDCFDEKYKLRVNSSIIEKVAIAIEQADEEVKKVQKTAAESSEAIDFLLKK